MVRFSHLQFVWFFLIVVVFIALIFYNRWSRKGRLRDFAGEYLNNRLLDDYQPRLRQFREYLFIASLLFFSISSIGPQVGMRLSEVKRKGVDIIIALDTSLSMKAEDIKPNRLMIAKYEVRKFIDRLRGDRVG